MILHIINDYSGSTVYMNLVRELDSYTPQVIYNPIREVGRVNNNKIDLNHCSSKIIYRPILNYHTDRIFYFMKIKKIVKDIQKQVDFKKVNIIHAHTWYSDGGVAHELSKKYNIPYIITMRNTDFSIFQGKLRYLHAYGRKILNAAYKVIIISTCYRHRALQQKSLQSIKKDLENKIQVIPNGVDRFWLENCNVKNNLPKQSVKLLYVGRFLPRKKLLLTMKAVEQLNKKGLKCHLEIVGGGGAEEKKVLELTRQQPNLYTYHGKVYDKDKLCAIYRNADIFVMPSRNETFGLVYIEAMTQGLPLLYTKDEGIDGFYNDAIGEKVNKQADDVEIKNSLKKCIENYSNYRLPIEEIKQNHDWSLIAKKYIKIYNNMSTSVFNK